MCDVVTILPTFTAGRTNKVPLEFRDEDGDPIDLTGKTLRLTYWITETKVFVYEDEVEAGATGDEEFVHAIDAFENTTRAELSWVLDVIEGGEVEAWGQGTVSVLPVPPEAP